MQKFTIDEDDLEFAFNPIGNRKKMSKEQHLYGIWADDLEEIDNAMGSSKKMLSTKSISEPIGFISGGVSKPTIKDIISDEEEDDIKEDDAKQEKIKEKFFEKKKFKYKVQTVETKIGDWERHTKGIGQKLLLQMGYQSGKGLGKHGQGRTIPVEAIKRKGKGAIGAYGPEQNKKVENTTLIATTEPGKKKASWKKSQSNSNQTKSINEEDDLLSEIDQSKPFWAPEFLTGHHNTDDTSNKIKIIDMRGRETKITTGYESLSRKLEKPDLNSSDGTGNFESDKKFFDMPELSHNLDILLGGTEKALKLNRKRLAYEARQKDALANKRNKLEASIIDTQQEIGRLNKLLIFIDKFINPTEDVLQNLDDCKKLLEMFRDEFKNELKLYDFKNIISALVFPMLKNVMESWRPLEQPDFIFDKLIEWKRLLGELESDIGGCRVINPPNNRELFARERDVDEDVTFQKFLWYIWMPKIRRCVQTSWNPRASDQLIDLINIWQHVIPYWLKHNLLDQLIVPKLLSELAAWDPTVDTVPVHSWIHPWMPYVESAVIETAFSPIIRDKLGNALRNWESSDKSAKIIIAPWRSVFKAKDFDLFLIKYIMPKLNDLAYNLLKKASSQQVSGCPGNPYILNEDGSASSTPSNYGNVIETSLVYGFKSTDEDPSLDQSNKASAAVDITDWYTNEWLWILDWEAIMAPAHLLILLQNTFFPIMKVLLKRALSEIMLPLHLKTLGTKVDFLTISEWYMNWKNLFPTPLLDKMEIKAEFDSLLNIINAHLISLENAPPPPPPNFQTVSDISFHQQPISTAAQTNFMTPQFLAQAPGGLYHATPSGFLPHPFNNQNFNPYMPIVGQSPYPYTYVSRGEEHPVPPEPSIVINPPPPPPPTKPVSVALELGNPAANSNNSHSFYEAQAVATVKATFDYAAYVASTNELTFKEFVQNKLEHAGVVFGPSKATNIYHLNLPANKQLYKVIGSNNRPLQVYIDKGVLFVYHQSFNQTSNNNNIHNSTQFHWKPIAVTELIKLANY